MQSGRRRARAALRVHLTVPAARCRYEQRRHDMPNLNIHPAPLGGPFEESPHELTAQWLGAHLRKALREGSFEVHYQPLVTARREAEAYEALVRFRHPKLGMVPPAKFIPMAERNGMIVPIGEWVLQEACSQAAQWAGIGVRRPVSVEDPHFNTRAIVGAIVSMARDMGVRTVAEGVESEAQFYLLRELGCDLFQGYLFARPRPAAVLFSERQPGRLQ